MNRLAGYITGFALSVVLTLLPAGLAWAYMAGYALSPVMLYALFVACALAQLFVQLYFFLHITEERRPRWNALSLCFAVLITGIVAGGTLWIMDHLDHSMPRVPYDEGIIAPHAAHGSF